MQYLQFIFGYPLVFLQIIMPLLSQARNLSIMLDVLIFYHLIEISVDKNCGKIQQSDAVIPANAANLPTLIYEIPVSA